MFLHFALGFGFSEGLGPLLGIPLFLLSGVFVVSFSRVGVVVVAISTFIISVCFLLQYNIVRIILTNQKVPKYFKNTKKKHTNTKNDKELKYSSYN
tara:strand:+ start:1707 stop:1994 length:288 start_codon:yes stop_codon:yes gene_type:complete